MIKKLLQKILKKYQQILFVGSTDILPEPLSKEEEIKYVELSMKNNQDAKNKLIEHNLRLVVFLAKKYDNTKTDLEDLVSIGTIGLIKAINTYKLDKNIKLATYASRCIDNEILMHLRKIKRKKTEISFEDSLSYDADGNELHLEDVLGTEKDIVTKGLDEELDKSIMMEEIEKLSPRDKEIIELRYGLNKKKEMTQKDIVTYLINTNEKLYNDYQIYQGIEKAINSRDKELFFNIVNNNKNNKNVSKKMRQALKTFKDMEKYISNSLDYEYSNGIVEGINNVIKQIKHI